MKNQDQISRKNSRLSSSTQASRRSRGDCRLRLGDAGAVLFDEIYQDIRGKSFDEAVCLFEAMLGLTKYNPALEAENTALKLITQGAARLAACMPVLRSRELNNS